MEEKRSLIDYLAQVMITFGVSMLLLNILCIIFGESAQEISAIFGLGSQGIPVAIVFQYLIISVLIVALRILFFTDCLIKRMPMLTRLVCMLISVVAVIVAFIIMFDWFPVDHWRPWIMFLISFGVSFLVSCLVMKWKEKSENRKLEEGLRRLKGKELEP